MAWFELYGIKSLFVILNLGSQTCLALFIPVVVLGFHCGFFLQVKFEVWKEGVMDIPQDGHSGSGPQPNTSFPPWGNALGGGVGRGSHIP